MNTEVMFSSKKMDWATPQDFYDKLNSEFHFTLDPVQTSPTTNVTAIIQSGTTDLNNAGGGRPCFVILHMGERSRIG